MHNKNCANPCARCKSSSLCCRKTEMVQEENRTPETPLASQSVKEIEDAHHALLNGGCGNITLRKMTMISTPSPTLHTPWISLAERHSIHPAAPFVPPKKRHPRTCAPPAAQCVETLCTPVIPGPTPLHDMQFACVPITCAGFPGVVPVPIPYIPCP